ncbi:hypothetical protein A2818_00845 [Candidatus Nomurabacteria bacterium RIFCSPHIGHO2_01_FULL_40_12]|uniref:General secretion pathway GspH domain-containing protein n=1 Tax=Candidatus Nomurabacteria bacterium RIFCSPHIGHO2_01_FULL_40_12 TaxID=1801737 RepID=A0A1F6UZF0_9BACT|nr:MAG: hypothetical protein A2818_00845 [Candidatus Nomurabacteria bacterium RIFCSPHIGHO2_01_FULL_40_12]
MNNFYQKGISIIELLVVFAGIILLVLIILPQFSKLRENQVLKTAVNDTLSALNKARGKTLASFNSSSYGVHFQSDKAIIFSGTAFSAPASDNEDINIISPASITNVTLNSVSGSSGEMYFNRLTGMPSKTGTITISSPSFSKIITISSTGVASSN